MRSYTFLAGVLACRAAVVAAQAPPAARDSVVSLPAMSTTATRNASTTLTTPLAVTTITPAELRSEVGYGLEDALRMVPGVIAQSRYGTSDVRLIIRGYGARGAGDRSNSGTSRGIRVLIDGFPETEPDGRTAFDHVDLATSQSVEVVRSNASALWGNAAGGVVNLLSRPSVTSAGLEVQPMYGDYGLRRLVMRTAAPLGEDGAMWVSFTNSTFDGWRAHSDARRVLLNAGAEGSLTERTRAGMYVVAANNLMHIPGPLTPAQYAADASQANATYAARDERRYNRLGRVGLSLDHDVGRSTTISTSFFVNPKYLQRSERNTFRDFTRYHVGGSVLARTDVAVGQSLHRWSAGVDEAYQDGSIQFYTLAAGGSARGALTDNKGEGAQNLGAFLQDEMHLNERVSLVLGARYDRVAYNYRTFFDPNAMVKQQSKHFDRVSPKLGVSYRLGATQSLYANVGGGVEVPAGNETDQPPTGPIAGALLNPLLDAINSTTYEAGYKALAMPVAGGAAAVGLDVALYDTEVQNEVVPYSGGRYYQTAARARRNGAELGVNTVSRAGLFASVALTFNNHTYGTYVVDSSVMNAANTGKADYSGNQVMGVPKVLANGELGMELPFHRALRLSAGAEHSGEYYADDANLVRVPSYTIFNTKLELRTPIVAANGVALRGFVSVSNLTNVKYVGSAFLNPDYVAGEPAVYEPGTPRALVVSLSLATW